MQKEWAGPFLPLKEGELCWEILKKSLLSGAAVSSTGNQLVDYLAAYGKWGNGPEEERAGRESKRFQQ